MIHLVSQEVNHTFVMEGDSVYSYYYDHEKAFDTVYMEFCVMLEQLVHIGVRRKCWRLACEPTHSGEGWKPTISLSDRKGDPPRIRYATFTVHGPTTS